MDELNRPLGQKPERPADSRKSVADGKLIALAGLTAGLLAIGLVGWQMFLAPKPEPVIVQIEKKPETAAPAVQTPNPESVKTEPADEEEETYSESGLNELKPNGSISVPKPRLPRVKPQEAGLAHLPDPDLIEEGATGGIPKRASDGRRAMDVYAREPNTTGNFGVARVVIIVGGMGVSQSGSQLAIRKLPPAVTLAFAPYGNSLNRWMQSARQKGHELLLQLPMEPFGYPQNSPGPHTIVSGVSAEENQVNLHWLLSRITNYVGVMNYQGGKILGDGDALKPVFDEIAERGLLFVDDGSVSNSKAGQAAAASVLPNTSVQIQIDAKRTRRDIAEQLEKLVLEAKRSGLAIGVSNGFSDTIEMIAEFAAQAGKLGIEITPVSAIVDDPERPR